MQRSKESRSSLLLSLSRLTVSPQTYLLKNLT